MTQSPETGARPDGPGSREPSPSVPSVSAASGFDPSRGPQRAHDLILRMGADTIDDLIWGLRALADDARQGLSASCCSGSPSVGFMYSYRHDPAQTHDVYFQQIDEFLARDSDGSGEAGETAKQGSTAGDSADPKGIAQSTDGPTP